MEDSNSCNFFICAPIFKLFGALESLCCQLLNGVINSLLKILTKCLLLPEQVTFVSSAMNVQFADAYLSQFTADRRIFHASAMKMNQHNLHRDTAESSKITFQRCIRYSPYIHEVENIIFGQLSSCGLIKSWHSQQKSYKLKKSRLYSLNKSALAQKLLCSNTSYMQV